MNILSVIIHRLIRYTMQTFIFLFLKGGVSDLAIRQRPASTDNQSNSQTKTCQQSVVSSLAEVITARTGLAGIDISSVVNGYFRQNVNRLMVRISKHRGMFY